MKSRSFFLLILMCVGISGCGGDSVTDEPVPANFISATPPSGEIYPLAPIKVLFDKPPIDVVVNFGTVTVAGRIATISGPFTPGPLTLRISWAGGSYTIGYIVHGPCCQPPTITGGTVTDGATDVDPEVINSDGKIVILFSEDVSGNIVLQTESGDNVGWIGKIEGSKATLELVKGKEIANETTYVIRGKISDAKGNAADYSVTFVTKGKA